MLNDPHVKRINCPSTTLRMGEKMTCTGEWVDISKNELADGSADNVATVTGFTLDGVMVRAEAESHVPVKVTNKTASGKLSKTGTNVLLIAGAVIVLSGGVALLLTSRKVDEIIEAEPESKSEEN